MLMLYFETAFSLLLILLSVSEQSVTYVMARTNQSKIQTVFSPQNEWKQYAQ